MRRAENLTSKAIRTVVLGLGRTGLSCARFLARHGHGVTVMDSRAEPPALDALRAQVPGAEVVVGGFDEARLEGAELVVVSPGIPSDAPILEAARQRGIDVIGDIELFARHAKAPVVAITGSNGKSTVTTLLGQMAQIAGKLVRVGGNIGVPALDLLGEWEPDLYILELSSFQLETTHSLAPQAAVVLNVSQDHLDRYPSLDAYAATKARIYRNASVAVVNLDDPKVAAMVEPGRRSFGFTLAAPQGRDQFGIIEHEGERWLARGEEALLPVSKVRLVGRHNLANVLACLALGTAAGLPMEAMLRVLPAFTGLDHRCQWVAEVRGIDWYNDSKATNVGATVAAIEGMERPVVLIAGGQAKGQDFAPLREAVERHCRALVVMGEDGPLIEQAVGGAAEVARAADMGEAVERAAALARPGDVVLLSPACASFDMFDGFESRGHEFAAAVRRLAS